MLCLVTQSCLCNPMDCRPPGSSVHGDSAGKNTRVGCHALLQGIFPNPGTPSLPHCMRILYPLSHPGSLRRARMGFQGQKSLGLETQMSLSKSDGNPPFLGTAAVCSGFLPKGQWKSQLRGVVSWPLFSVNPVLPVLSQQLWSRNNQGFNARNNGTGARIRDRKCRRPQRRDKLGCPGALPCFPQQ